MSLSEASPIQSLPALPKPHPGGRPSLYKPEYCAKVIELAKEGWSQTEIADELDVAKSQLNEWASRYPEFLNALSRAKTAEQRWWESTGRKALEKQGFNDRLWRTSMQARFREDYTERQIVQTDSPAQDGDADVRQLARALLAGLAIGQHVTENKGLSPRDKANILESTVSETLTGKPEKG